VSYDMRESHGFWLKENLLLLINQQAARNL